MLFHYISGRVFNFVSACVSLIITDDFNYPRRFPLFSRSYRFNVLQRKRLNVLQRKMVRFVNWWKPREHVGDLEIKSVGWLLFPKRASLTQLCHLFKVRTGLAPSYLSHNFCPIGNIHSHHTRGSEFNYSVDSKKFPPNTFHYTVVREWNNLPHDAKCAPSLASFKRKLKQYFMS